MSLNSYSVALRNFRCSTDCMQDNTRHLYRGLAHAVSQVQRHGCVNYFHEQKFGTGTMPQSPVGWYALNQKYKKALHSLILESPAMKPHAVVVQKIAECLKKDDYTAALEALPRRTQGKDKTTTISAEFADESFLLKKLESLKGNHEAAYLSLPLETKVKHLEAWSSKIWNLVVTRRLQKYNQRIFENDLYYKEDNSIGVVKDAKTCVVFNQVVMATLGAGLDIRQEVCREVVELYNEVLLKENSRLTFTTFTKFLNNQTKMVARSKVSNRASANKGGTVNSRKQKKEAHLLAPSQLRRIISIPKSMQFQVVRNREPTVIKPVIWNETRLYKQHPFNAIIRDLLQKKVEITRAGETASVCSEKILH
eukprot:Platyproteum_vivax@DN6766_c0_g1_i2.p1